MLGLFLLAAAVSAQPGVRISDLQPIADHDGVNPVAHLSPDGRNGLIVSGWRNTTPGADGESRDYLVLLAGRQGQEVVVADTIPSLVSDLPFGGNVLRAAPHTGEDWKRVIRFAYGRVGDAPATLMILAERDMRRAENAYAPEPVQITYFRLDHDQDAGEDRFIPIRRSWSTRCYVDANLALRDEARRPLPPDYAGPKAAAPCGPSQS
jgi:hypothetical protein